MNHNILIVDDVPENLFTLKRLLMTIDGISDKEVIEALSGEEALRIAMKMPLSLIILDIQMPQMNGFEVAKFLKSSKKTRQIPVIFLTAVFKQEEFIRNGFDLGAIDYFTKPIESFQFTKKIEMYLRMFSYQDELLQANRTLEQRVQEEIEKNRQNEALMMSKQRFVQLGEMISMIAHQWRQPLAAIASTTDAIRMDFALNTFCFDSPEAIESSKKSISENLDQITHQAIELSQTIDGLRKLYKPDTTDVLYKSFGSMIGSVTRIVSSSLEHDGIKLEEEGSGTISFPVHENEMIQVLLSLVKNAREALLERKVPDPRIIIRYLEHGICLCDNAGGIPDDIIGKVFDPYFSTKSGLNGTGLGLYMAKMIVEKHHHGSMTVANDGTGACVTISLPL